MRSVWLIARREITTRLSSKSFIAGTLATVAIIVICIIGSTFLPSGENDTPAMTPEFAKQSIQAQDQAFADVIQSHGLNPVEVKGEIATATATALDAIQGEDSSASMAGYFLGIGIAILLFVALQVTGQMIAQGVVEEKGSKVVEIILGTVSSFKLMLGKILGVGVVGVLQMALITGSAYVAARAVGMDVLGGVSLSEVIVVLIVAFLVAYFLYATLFAALASTVSRQEEVPQVITPVMILMMMSYIPVVIPGLTSNLIVKALLTYVPLVSNISMPAMFAMGEIPLWQCLVSLGISALTLPFIIWVASRIYQRSILQSGPKVKWLKMLVAKSA
jgi:ABC-2 type transport system permease protein